MKASSRRSSRRPQPVHPRQAQSLHPSRGVGLHAGINIESEPDGQDDAAPQPWLVALYPGLLFGRAEADPNEIRREPVDFLDDLLVRGAFHAAIGLALAVKGADESQAGV